MEKMIEQARTGDFQAMKFVLERLYPVPKSRRLEVPCAEMKDAATVAAAYDDIAAALSRGDLFIDEAHAIASILENRRRAIETSDIEARLAALEAEKGKG